MLRPARAEDLAGILAVQAACYDAGFCEPPDVWQERLACTAAHWRVAVDAGGGLLAYLAAYPSVQGCITLLHGGFEPAAAADTLYLHDLAVHPAAAGRGLGRALVAALLAQGWADGLRQAALVAVQGAAGFWKRQGFVPAVPMDPAVLSDYGDGAAYMVVPIHILPTTYPASHP